MEQSHATDREEPAPEALLLLVRPAAEMSIKARGTRDAFRRRFKANLKDALKRAHLDARVAARYSRTLVTVHPGDEDPEAVRERALETLGRVFGVGSFSPVEARCAARLGDIVATGAERFAARVRGRRYAVRCKRHGHHDFSSVDVERELGAAINEGATVDLGHPEVTVSVEVQGGRAWLFAERYPGPGGLPLGTGGRALALLSGGYDSAVAAWYVMKRGIEVDFVFCQIGGQSSERRALQVAKVLTDRWAAGTRPDVYVVDFRGVVEGLRGAAEESYWQVLLKRQMLRAGDATADAIDASRAERAAARRQRRAVAPVDALITGEVIAQVSSQTLSNLRAIDDAARRPVLRPLIGMDKLEIIARAEHIGTATLSAQVREDCAITPGHPVTHSSVERVRAEHEAVAAAPLADALAGARRIALRPLRAEDLTLPYLYTDEVPEGAVLLDCRPDAAARGAAAGTGPGARAGAGARGDGVHGSGPNAAASGGGWRPPGAVAAPMPALLGRLRELDKEPTYVLFCPVGTQSAQAAEVMQQLGFEAYSFRGGAPALRRWLERRDAAPASLPAGPA